MMQYGALQACDKAFATKKNNENLEKFGAMNVVKTMKLKTNEHA